jgi:GNAT superfamily N-acetyltransferase
MSSIIIQPANTKAEKEAFIRFAWSIYANYPHWVPPLLMDMRMKLINPKFSFNEFGTFQLYMAFRDGKPVGRIAAVENRLYNKTHEDKTGFFGFFECIDDQSVADKLFDTAADWLRQRGLSCIHGPASPSSNHDYGLLVDAYDDDPRLMMSYNPPYYRQLIENYGFRCTQRLFAHKIDRETLIQSETKRRLERVSKLVQERTKVQLRPINLKDMHNEVNIIKDIWNVAWEKNYGFAPMTNKEIDEMAEGLKPIAEPALIQFGMVNNKVIGVAIALLDYNYILKGFNGKLFPFNFLKMLFPNKKKIEWVRVIVLGLLPEYRGKGLDAFFYNALLDNCTQHFPHVKFAEASWTLEDNFMINRAMESLDAKIYKTYHVYEKPL